MGRIVSTLIIIAVAFALAGCADQAGVSNQTNNFSYGGQAAGKDKTETYTWQNTMGGAQVHWGGQVGKGSLQLIITDAAGQTVFSRTLSEGQQDGFSGNTAGGAPGDWTIQLTFKGYTGQMGLSIQAAGGSGASGWMP